MAVTETKSRMGLGGQIFLLTALLIVLMVLAAVGTGVYQGQRRADATVEETLSRSSVTQFDIERLRAREAELVAEIIAKDTAVTSYVAEAAAQDVLGSISDLIAERQAEYEFDLAVVMDAEGRVLARTDRPVRPNETLAGDPLVKELINFLNPISAVWPEGEELYQIAMTPMDQNFTLIGFLAIGQRIGDELSQEIKSATGTDQMWLNTANRVMATTLADDDGTQVVTQLAASEPGLETLFSGAAESVRVPVEISGSQWMVSGEAVALDENTMAAAVLTLVNVDAIMSPYQRQALILAGVGALVIVAGLALSLALSQRLARPLKVLTEAATAAGAGHYEQHFDHGGSKEIVGLSSAFESLLSDLREKRDMEEYVSDLSRYLPDPAFEQGSVSRTHSGGTSPGRETLALLALDYRHMVNPEKAGSPEDNLRRFQAQLSQIAALAEALDARLESFSGHRAVIGFRGADAIAHALEFSGHVAEYATDQPSMGLVKGQVDRGMVRAGMSSAEVLIGKASHQVDLLLEEATTGALLFSPAIRDEVDALLAEISARAQVHKGRVSGRKYFAVRYQELSAFADTVSDRTLATSRTEAAETVIESVSRTREIVPGDLFAGRFEIVSILGQGGMGMVYKALDRELDDFVALKTLLPSMAEDEKYLNQLKEEIKLARRITHPNVLRTFDFGSHGGLAYISMEYVRGMTLKYLMRQRSRLPFSAGLRIVRQTCAGLEAAHAENVVHRDIKPENIILEAAGNAKLMDFGIAHPVANDEADSGVFFGTPRYAAPEQMAGKAVGAPADVFACGVVMYELFGGATPFPQTEMMQNYEAKRDGLYEPLRSLWEECPETLDTVVSACLKADVSERFADAGALAQALAGLRA
ncbi:MAG: protein kinase [Pseudomonadota bacterium]